MIDFSPVLKKALSRGGVYADIYLERSMPFSIVCEDGRIEKVLSGMDHGAGIRIIFGQRTAYAFTNEVTNSALMELAEAVSHAAADGARSVDINLNRRRPHVDFSVKKAPESMSTQDKTAMVMRANRTARAVDARIRQAMVVYRESRQSIEIATSTGVLAQDDRLYLTALVHVVAADGDVVQTGYEPVGGSAGLELLDDYPLEKAAEAAARRAIRMLSARKAPAGRMPVVLSSDAGGTMIHEAVGHGLEADLAQSGLSVYSNRVGERIASPLITVVDDATLPGKRGSFRFDDEATDAERTVLVENGMLKTFMYDRLTAMKDGAASTGNGRRESYKHRPIPRMTNTMILPGGSDPREILRSTPKGLFVKKMGGGQVNTVNGDFVFEVSEGYLIENGNLGDPVRGATLTGNGPQVLLSIDQVGSDLGFSIGTCGKDGQGSPVSDAQPTLRIPEIVVGGVVG
ncbi:MAG: peptidase C69 [Nitrospirae bacterium GWD2_57_9]|nr:MAG: peptidase C69 [Nitrospirae bacterium GWD2_57_9]OGW47527.1 MAG: peptidase C69 [Nitrospirae bacterium GWC2_57_9]